MSKINNVVNFLNELDSRSTKNVLGDLREIVGELEEKNDPEPLEIEIVDVANQVLEKLELLHAAFRKYSNEENVLTGDKLSNLYGKNKSGGTSALFDD